MNKLRTWTLIVECQVVEGAPPGPFWGESILVLEAEPILDLLEMVYASEDPKDALRTLQEIGSLLRDHGRLS